MSEDYKKNPWTTLSEREIYENNWIQITEHGVLNPGNKKTIYGVVSFKNIAVGIVALDQELNTWLIGQYRYPLKQYSWEIPEGGSPKNVLPLESAKRELMEEAGIVAKAWKKIQEIHTSNSTTDELGIIYLATDLSFFPPEPEEDERLEIRKVPFETAYQMVINGEITDSLSIAGIFRVKYLIDQNLIDV